MNPETEPNESIAIIDLYKKHAANNQARTRENYKGLGIHAMPGLHDYAANVLKQNIPEPAQSGVLDIGAGSGAMSMRLADLGFNQIYAMDIVPENFKVSRENIEFFAADCNVSFFKKIPGPVDAITAIEIIEHIENPRHLIRECAKIIQTGGKILVTTPNIDSSRSKADFIANGHFHMFGRDSYSSSGHITPLSVVQLKLIFEENNLNLIHHSTYGSHDYSVKTRPKMAVFQKLIQSIQPRKNWGDGSIHVMLLEKQ